MMSEKAALLPSSALSLTVYFAALTWPWGAYQQFWGKFGLFSLALILCLIDFFVHWARHGRPTVPFDLLWPAALIAVCSGAYSLWTGQPGGQKLAMGSCAFVAALHGAANRTLALRALTVSVLSAGGIAVTTVLAEHNRVFPTFFSQSGDTVVAGPSGLMDALFLFAWATLAGFGLALRRKEGIPRLEKWMLPVALLCTMTAFSLLIRRTWTDFPGWNQDYGVLAFPFLPLLLMCLYLPCRCCARVLVLANTCGQRPHRFQPFLVLLSAFVAAFFSHIPEPGLWYSLGLVSAFGIPRSLRNASPVSAVLAWLVLVPVLVAHVFLLFPGDARDYLLQARQTGARFGPHAAEMQLWQVLQRYPGESKARLELARIRLDQGETEGAADAFQAVLRERRRQQQHLRLDRTEVQEFIDKLGQQTRGTTGIPFERCLVACGRVREALHTLKSRLHPRPTASLDPDVFRLALACQLGCSPDIPELASWSVAELLAGLALSGTFSQSMQAPPGVPRRLLPAVLVSRPLEGGRIVTVFHPGGQFGRFWRIPRCLGYAPMEGQTWWLDPVLDPESGEWFAPLAGSADVYFGRQMDLSLLEDPLVDCGPGPGDWAVLCLLP